LSDSNLLLIKFLLRSFVRRAGVAEGTGQEAGPVIISVLHQRASRLGLHRWDREVRITREDRRESGFWRVDQVR
jgi:hypothetical protein